MKRTLAYLLAVVMLLAMCACSAVPEEEIIPEPVETEPEPVIIEEPEEPEIPEEPEVTRTQDIAILCTNDVHCGADEGIGYEGLARMKEAFLAENARVILVDGGDAIQGGLLGSLSKGESIIEVMNALNYEVAVPGNHEFDYGVDRLMELSDLAEYDYVSCNFTDSDGNAVFAPYKIIEADGVKIGFVGICTPTTITSSTPAYFMDEDGNYVYSFGSDETGETLYSMVQQAVDGARAEGAEIVIALGHLGISEACSPWTSSDVIVNTTGIDVLLDGHSHTYMEPDMVLNADGESVVLCQAGTKMEAVSCITLKMDGTREVSLLTDPEAVGVISNIKAANEELIKTVVAETGVDLYIHDPEDPTERIVRLTETNLGDLCADAVRAAFGADIAVVNSGNVRVDLPAGEITYGDIISVHPFGNGMGMAECTGQQVLDLLECACSALPNEFGGFMQVSGITFTVDMNVESSCEKDANNMFLPIEADAARRVKDVKVGDEPIDPEALYTLASSSYVLFNNGDGHTALDGCTLLQEDTMLDSQVLIDYITETLSGTVGEEYKEPYGDGRITFIQAN